MGYLQPPFPAPTDEAGAILAIGQIAFIVLFMILYIYLGHFACKKKRSMPLTLLVWGFSIDLGFGMIVAPAFPFKPMLPTFFMVWQTIMLIECALEYYNNKYKGKARRGYLN